MTSLAFAVSVLPLAPRSARARTRGTRSAPASSADARRDYARDAVRAAFFYLFDRIKERREPKAGAPAPVRHSPRARGGGRLMRRATIAAARLRAAWCGPDYQRPEVRCRRSATSRRRPRSRLTSSGGALRRSGPGRHIARRFEHNQNAQAAVANVEQAAILTTTRSPLFRRRAIRATPRASGSASAAAPWRRTSSTTPRRPTRCSPARAGNSTCGAAYVGSPSPHGRTCSRRTTRAAAWCCRSSPRSPPPTSSSSAWTSSSRSPTERSRPTGSR
jgi:hypothetical protein